ncbi:VOC family protein [Actinoplanes sp. NPDC049265]|uniref:VOC family protein n=1 Tax=Actinoplanes sp. NPDC049265 TaxID=3363902 RepID=UPI0037124310
MTLHHVELWVPDLEGALTPWGWLLGELGYTVFQQFEGGRSFLKDGTYLVLEQSAALTGRRHDRCAPGLNHLAFTVAGESEVDRLSGLSETHGWSLMYADRHPHAGGPEHYAAYLEDAWGYEVELCAGPPK